MELYTCPCASHDISDQWFPRVSGCVIGNDHAKRSLKMRRSLVRSACEGKLGNQKVFFAAIWRMWSLFAGWIDALGRPSVSAIRISQVVAFSRTHSVHLNPWIEGTEIVCLQFSGGRFCQVVARTGSTAFSTAERSERVENFLFRATREYTEAGIEQRCLGANSPEPRRRAAIGWRVSAQTTSSYITARPWLPGLIVGPCPSKESLCCPACPPTLRCLRVSAPVSNVACLISLFLRSTCMYHTFSHITFLGYNHMNSRASVLLDYCYPNTSSNITCVLGGGLFPVTAHGFSSKGVAAVRARRLFPSTISGVRGSVPVVPLGRKLDWQPVLSRAPKDPHLAV